MESIWLKNPNNLLKYYTNYSIYNYSIDNNTNIDGSIANKFNIISRLLILSGFIFTIFKRYNWSYICFIFLIIITMIGYKYDDHTLEQETIAKQKEYNSCRRSTINNPMSNLLPFDSQEELEACKEDSEIIQSNLLYDYYEDQNNLNSRAKLTNFITMPVTSVLGKREEFMKFTYGDAVSCKYDGINCAKYRDIKYSF